MLYNLKKTFKFIAWLEGLSYILLLIATAVKYFLHNEKYVQILGMPHGVLFIIYVLLALFIRKKMNWTNYQLLIIMLASIIPFGTFYIDLKYIK